MDYTFTRQQDYVFNKFIEGYNIFITGPAGTGKSQFIYSLVKYCKENNKKYQVCAMTGCAAILLKCRAKTIHSWSGIGIESDNKKNIISKINSNYGKRNKWKQTDVLIVDEVSMMSDGIFELLFTIGQITRNNFEKPFGGIQLVFCGDFFQLPPIRNDFCFKSPLFRETFSIQIEFTRIFRQKDDIYCKLLNEIRIGNISKESISILQKYVNRPTDKDNKIIPTRLFPIKSQVDKINNNEMSKLKDDIVIYEMKKECKGLEKECSFLMNNLNCCSVLKLKKGCQVMCIVNLDIGNNEFPIGNGSLGIVIDFTSNHLPIVQFKNGTTKTIQYYEWISEEFSSLVIKQIPLVLSWAMTIHKSQGSTLEMATIDLGNQIFECGQSYVALSRVSDLDGLYLSDFNPKKITVNKDVLNFYDNLWKEQKKINLF